MKNIYILLLLLLYSQCSFSAEVRLKLDRESCSDSEVAFLDTGLNYKDANAAIDENFGKNCKIEGIYLNGYITQNTLSKIQLAFKLLEKRKFYLYPPKYKNLSTNRLSLNSNGGLVMEAIKIGNFIADKNVSAFVPSKCYSSCVFIYVAAKERYAAGEIGVHRPFSKDISIENLNYYEYLEKYKSLEPKFENYFSKFGVSKNLVSLMSSISSEEMKILTFDELESYGLNQNIAAQEYERARKIQLCGQEFYDLDIKYRKYLKSCVMDTDTGWGCSIKANKKYPDRSEKLLKCIDKMYERIK